MAIYFISDLPRTLVKIGSALHIPRRLKGIQAACPVMLELLGWSEGDHLAEKRLHKQFHDLHHHGEWFRFDQRVLDAIEYRVKSRSEITKLSHSGHPAAVRFRLTLIPAGSA